MDSTVAKRIWHMVRAVYYMLRKGINKRKIMMDLHLLLHRGKIAGKSLRHLMTSFHHHHHRHPAASPAFSCLYVDPSASFYAPREVEFSCSSTPMSSLYPYFHVGKQKHRHARHDHAAEEIAKVFEILNAAAEDAESAVSAAATPSPAPFVRQLRITDSPFPLREEEEEDEEAEGGELDGAVDREAEEFIKRFYEQLRLQPSSVGSTPECSRFGRRRTLAGRN